MSKKAFSIIEVAITIAIIAVIATGATIGTKIYSTAQLNTIVNDAQKFTMAINEFANLYGALPGDISDVTTLPMVASSTAGNGDGKIDSVEEAINAWLHLSLTNLIPSNFTGTINNTPYMTTSGPSPGAIPAGNIEGSGFSISTNDDSGLIFNFSGFNISTNSYDNAILSPEDALYIDSKFDDGDPNAGLIRGFDGSNVAANSCVTVSGAYNLNISSKTCYLKIITNLKSEVENNIASKCDGSNIGKTRISSSILCPMGQYGNVIETCQNNGTWQHTQSLCQPFKCSESLNKSVGDTIDAPCPLGSSGQISFECSSGGTWLVSTHNCSAIANQCNNTTNRFITRNIGCPLGYTGSWSQICPPGGTNYVDQFNCLPLTCSTGAVYANNYAGACSSGWSAGADNSYFACTLPVITGANTGASSDYQLIRSACKPTYLGGCTPGATLTRPCHDGKISSAVPPTGFILQCNEEGVWEMLENTCININCDGEPIGSFRLNSQLACPVGTIGNMLEICSYDNNYLSASWKSSTIGCSQVICPEITNMIALEEEGFASRWPQANAGALAISNDCFPNYSGSSSRYCGIDGQWQTPETKCEPVCAEGDHNPTNTNWAAANKDTIVYIMPDGSSGNNKCQSGYYTGEFILRECRDVGGVATWQDPVGGEGSGNCVPGTGGFF